MSKTLDERQQFIELRAKDELNSRDMSSISTNRLITIIIKLSDILKDDETDLNLKGDYELAPWNIGEQTTWKI